MYVFPRCSNAWVSLPNPAEPPGSRIPARKSLRIDPVMALRQE